MIKEEELSQIVEEGRKLNLRQMGTVRKGYLSQIRPFLDRKEVIIIKGIRRAGKSTIMKQLMHILIKEKQKSIGNIVYVNLEDYKLLDSLDFELLEELLKFRENKNDDFYLFIDEIQLIPKWEKWVRTHYDKNEGIRFIISGSCASLLDKEYATALTGRNITFQVRPLSFTEFLSFKNNKASLEEYLEFGGFPEVVLEKDELIKRKLLRQYLDDIVNKDIVNRHNVRDARQVYLLVRYLSLNAGQKISFNKIAKSFGLSVETVIRFVQYMKDAYLVSEVPFHSYSVLVKYDQTKLPKYYIGDNGLINILDAGFSDNVGKKYENAVFIKLNERYEVSYWQGEKEVDFIFDKTGVNVTATDKIPKREFESLKELKARDKNIKNLLLITPSTGKDGDIKIVPISYFLDTDVSI